MSLPNVKVLRDSMRRWAWIVNRFKSEGSSLAAIARANAISRSAVQSAKTKPYPRVEKLLADALGTDPATLFPDRYDNDGIPNRKPGRPPNCIDKSVSGVAKSRNTQGRKAV